MGKDTKRPAPLRLWRSSGNPRRNGEGDANEKPNPSKWTMGILEDKQTIEVPGMPANEVDYPFDDHD